MRKSIAEEGEGDEDDWDKEGSLLSAIGEALEAKIRTEEAIRGR